MIAPTDFVVWDVAWVEGVCRLESLLNVEKHGELAFNVSRADGFPADAAFRMSDDHPLDSMLADRLGNASGLVVVSVRVAELLESDPNTGPAEYLPVTIHDHRDRVVEERFVIVNPLEPVPCLDVEACGVRWNKIVPGKIRRVQRLALLPDRLPSDRALFKCDAFHKPTLVRRELAQKMDEMGLTGSQFTEVEEFRA